HGELKIPLSSMSLNRVKSGEDHSSPVQNQTK
ncbi:MFS transporter, partial [Acinetobacter baumannii]